MLPSLSSFLTIFIASLFHFSHNLIGPYGYFIEHHSDPNGRPSHLIGLWVPSLNYLSGPLITSSDPLCYLIGFSSDIIWPSSDLFGSIDIPEEPQEVIGQPQEVTLVPIIPHWAPSYLIGLPSSLNGPHFHQIGHPVYLSRPPSGFIRLPHLWIQWGHERVSRGNWKPTKGAQKSHLEPNEVSVELSEVIWGPQ